MCAYYTYMMHISTTINLFKPLLSKSIEFVIRFDMNHSGNVRYDFFVIRWKKLQSRFRSLYFRFSYVMIIRRIQMNPEILSCYKVKWILHVLWLIFPSQSTYIAQRLTTFLQRASFLPHFFAFERNGNSRKISFVIKM